MKKPIVKNQHYIPQGYLRKFELKEGKAKEKKRILVLNIKSFEFEPKKIKKTLASKFFYEADVENPDNILEDGFEQVLEGPFFRNIYDGERIKEEDIFSDSTKSFLSMYIAFQITKTDKFRKMMADLHGQVFKNIALILEKKGLINSPVPTKELKINIDEKLIHLKAMGEMVPYNDIIKDLFNKKWVLLKIKNESKINFCAYSSGVGIDSRCQIHTFPLSKNVCLVLYPQNSQAINNTVVNITGEIIDYINSVGLACSEKLYFSNTKSIESLKEFLTKYRNN